MKPQKFGRYLLLDRVASGGMAEVWRAKLVGEGGFQRMYAIKKILPHVAEDSDFITMFQDEAIMTSSLQHANIGQVFEFAKQGEVFYLAMEYISGKDLKTVWSHHRSKKKPFPIELSCHIVQKMSDGLDYAHRRKDHMGNDAGIIHRDVSPQNVLLSWDGEVKVIDFGIAKAADKSGRTRAGTLKGKFAYMAPEHIRGLPLDGRADVFALGVVLYELVCGERAFQADSEFSLLEQVRNVEIRPPTVVKADCPPRLEEIIIKALSRDRDQRYATAADLSEDLQRFMLQRGRAPSRHDLAAYLKQHFAADYEKEAKRLESYRDIVDAESGTEEVSASAAAAPASLAPPESVPVLPPQPRQGTSGASAAAPAPGGDGVEVTSARNETMFVHRRESLQNAREARAGRLSTGSTIRPAASIARPPAEADVELPGRRSKGRGAFIALGLAGLMALAGAAGIGYATLARPTGTIVVTVKGPAAGGARVLLDGAEVGVASPSLTLRAIPLGRHDIIAEAAGFVTFGQSYELVDGVLNVAAELKRVAGRVSISSTPSGAAVTVSGAPTGKVTPVTLDVEAETFHQVSVALDGYRPAQQEGVRVGAGLVVPLALTLAPLAVTITIVSEPPGAQVSLGRDVIGTTPTTLKREIDMPVPQITLEKKGCEKLVTSVPFSGDSAEERFTVTLRCK